MTGIGVTITTVVHGRLCENAEMRGHVQLQ
jgi:hypothetical protein